MTQGLVFKPLLYSMLYDLGAGQREFHDYVVIDKYS